MSQGIEAKAAFCKAAVWSTAESATAGDTLLMLSESIARSREFLPDDSAGQAFSQEADQGLITVGGDLNAYLRYEGLETLLAMAMGTAGEPTLAGTTAYDHELRLADNTEGLFGTLAMYKGFSVHEAPSIKVDGFTIDGDVGQPLRVIFHLIGDELNINTDSGANTVASMNALAQPAVGNRVLMRHATFLMGDADGAALDSGDEIAPSRFRITFRRDQVGDHLAGGADLIAEPTPGGFPSATLELDFPTYTSDTFITDLGQDTRKKVSISFTGQEIESGHDYAMTLLMPHVAITNAAAAVDGAGKIAHPITCSLLGAAVAPTGMTGITAPLAIDLTNTNSSDPLA